MPVPLLRTSGICLSVAPVRRHVPRHWSGMSWRGPAVRWRTSPPAQRSTDPTASAVVWGCLSGRVLVTKGSLTVSTLEPGDLFGAAALYNDSPDYATTLTAQGICRCLLLDQELLDRLLGEEALLRRNYLTYLTGRIRFLNARLGSLAVGDTEGRVVRYLLSSLSYGVVECSASGLARQLGISRASVYRAFQDLEQAGLIRREGRAILVPDPAALEGVRGSG